MEMPKTQLTYNEIIAILSEPDKSRVGPIDIAIAQDAKTKREFLKWLEKNVLLYQSSPSWVDINFPIDTSIRNYQALRKWALGEE